MNTGQTILTIGAFVLLSLVVYNTNHVFLNTDFSLAENRYRLEALSLITSYIEQTSQYFFDEASTDTASTKTLNDFTTSENFGFDPDDNSIMDDFDDFHGLVKIDTGQSGVIYKNRFEVEYVHLQGNQIVKSTNREFHKRMTIYITDAYDPPLIYKYSDGMKTQDTLQISFVYSYWFYN